MSATRSTSAPPIGTVESITLRATTLRDGAGTVWTVPNGTVLRIGNKSRDWSLGTVDVTVANPAQLDDAVAVIERVAAEVSALPDVAPALLEPIAVPGVESLGTDGAVVRVTARTSAGDQGQVLRTLRAALTRGLDAAGITPPTRSRRPCHVQESFRAFCYQLADEDAAEHRWGRAAARSARPAGVDRRCCTAVTGCAAAIGAPGVRRR